MGLNFTQFHNLVLVPSLEVMTTTIPYSEEAERLVEETIWHESDCYTFIAQWLAGDVVGEGGGMSSYERPTWDWIYRMYREQIKVWLKWNPQKEIPYEELYSNNKLMVIMTRLRYRVVPKKLPRDLESRSQYWFTYYNGSGVEARRKHYISHALDMPRISLV